MTTNHDRIRRLLDDNDSPTDHSLRAKSLGRALKSELPKTLTPFEWEQWYAEHGVPDSHQVPEGAKKERPWWRFARWMRGTKNAD
jgi:hypothetical protein